MFDLTGKRALITGATQGIGFAIAKTLAEAGNYITGEDIYIDGGMKL
jgi:NAD(P)-dependent dehydrogenase (short-subunit alcohol dehydrogenase family)